ncbi:hypothetical protein Sjap_012458 [Stephania japonica]|uniref:Serine/arginine-rich splicing factor 4 n=1 Tax=Stephania japonica TaxID=461633 RepID=A0AAP0IW27_9MAGN
MSLFIGNLSPRVRRDEVERAFHRFGRCKIQIRDGFGFAHYNLPGNAENALKALRGRIICGNPINLTWANKQPKSFQRNIGGSKFYEPYNERGLRKREDYGTRRTDSCDQSAFRTITEQPFERDVELGMNNLLDQETGQSRDDIVDHEGDNHPDVKENLVDQGASIEPNLRESGRWGESGSNPLDVNEVENGLSFDRYDPYHGYDRTNEGKDNTVTNSYDSYALGRLRGKEMVERPGDATSKPLDNSEIQHRCFLCGKTGHMKRNCPYGDLKGQGKFTRFDCRPDNNASLKAHGKDELKRRRIKPLEKLNSSEKQHRRDRNTESSGLGKRGRLNISENSSELKEFCKSTPGRDSKRKKKHQDVGGSTKYQRGRKGKISGLSSLLSDSTSSSLCSHSHSSYLGVSPTTRSARSRSRRASSKSSSYLRSKGSRSRSRSRSLSSLSLSVSRGKPSRPSPNKAVTKETSASPRSCVEKDANHKHKLLLTDMVQPSNGEPSLDICKQAIRNETPEEENRLKLEDEVCNNHQETLNEDEHLCHQRTVNEAYTPCMTPPEHISFAANGWVLKSTVQRRNSEDCQPAKTLDTLAPVEKLDMDAPTSQFKSSLSISSEEMYTVLKHHGLSVPEETERSLPADSYFGSARLWPWEIIYYRRLKKGPISIENYNKRIAQNEAFGIVDRYVRSSSGWGEGNHDTIFSTSLC